MNKISSIAVYGASSSLIPQIYKDEAGKLGLLMAEKHIRLINGAGTQGVMGASSDACLKAGGKVCGIIPRFMVENGWQHDKLTELIITENMHSRKERMCKEADAAIAFPGGCGTLEELSELITWKQLGLYNKPLVIMNINGFYDELLHFFQRAVQEHFMRPEHLRLWQVAHTAEEALKLVFTIPEWDNRIGKFAAL